MAELLVKAKEPWNNNAIAAGMSQKELTHFNARTRLGDIIVVKPDGWPWGKCECLPDFIIVKVPGIKVDDVKHLEQSLFDGTIRLKVRKYNINSQVVSNAVSLSKEIISLKDSTELLSNITTKSS